MEDGLHCQSSKYPLEALADSRLSNSFALNEQVSECFDPRHLCSLLFVLIYQHLCACVTNRLGYIPRGDSKWMLRHRRLQHGNCSHLQCHVELGARQVSTPSMGPDCLSGACTLLRHAFEIVR